MTSRYILDNFDQLVGVGDIIVYSGCSNSSATITRAEVLDIFETRTKIPYGYDPNRFYWSDYKMRVQPEGGGRKVGLSRAPFILVANGVDFDEYVSSLRHKYGMEDTVEEDHPRSPAEDPQG